MASFHRENRNDAERADANGDVAESTDALIGREPTNGSRYEIQQLLARLITRPLSRDAVCTGQPGAADTSAAPEPAATSDKAGVDRRRRSSAGQVETGHRRS
jgi:hypothetical protein